MSYLPQQLLTACVALGRGLVNPVSFLEPVNLQGCSSFSIPLREGVIQFRGDGSATAIVMLFL